MTISLKKFRTGFGALPPAIQKGNETSGYSTDGVFFTPKGFTLGALVIISHYQYLKSLTVLHEYFYNVSASRKNTGTEGNAFGTINLPLLEAGIYI